MASPVVEDYYALLGVHVGANDKQLRKAWRALAARWHPDRAGHEATVTFQQISAAYTVLSDPLTRAAYDRRRRASMPAVVSPPRPPPQPVRPPTPSVMLKRLCGQLDSLLTFGSAHLDEPGFITLVLRDTEAAQGGMAVISMYVDLWCSDCAKRESSTGCPRCGGTRMVEELYSAWIAVPPGVKAGEVLVPSAELAGMVEGVRFKIGIGRAK